LFLCTRFDFGCCSAPPQTPLFELIALSEPPKLNLRGLLLREAREVEGDRVKEGRKGERAEEEKKRWREERERKEKG